MNNVKLDDFTGGPGCFRTPLPLCNEIGKNVHNIRECEFFSTHKRSNQYRKVVHIHISSQHMHTFILLPAVMTKITILLRHSRFN